MKIYYKQLLITAMIMILWKDIICPVADFLLAAPDWMSGILVFNRLLSVLLLLFLYYFIRIHKQQQISFIAVITSVVVTIISNAIDIIDDYHPLLNHAQPEQRVMMQQMYIYIVPALINTIATIIIAIQLIRNSAQDSTEKFIRLAGIAMLISLLFLAVIMIFVDVLIPDLYIYIPFASVIVQLFAGISFILMYREELKLQAEL